MPHLSVIQYTYAVVEEVDAEDEEGNISKELYILQVAPLKSHAGYRSSAMAERMILTVGCALGPGHIFPSHFREKDQHHLPEQASLLSPVAVLIPS